MMDSAQSTISNLKSTLPKGWRWVKLGEVCEYITDGTHITPYYVNEGVPFLSVKNVRENGLDFRNVQYISRDEHEKLIKRCHPKKGDVLYTKVGTTGIAKAIDVDKEFSIFVSVALLRPDKAYVIPEYLEKVLNSPICKEQAKALTQGIGNQNLVIKDLKKIEFPLSPKNEQRRIAVKIQELMQEIERAKASCEKQLDATNALPPAYLCEVFESDEAKKWERKRLGEVLETVESGSRPKGGVHEIKEGIPSVGAEHLNSFSGFNFENIRYIPKEFYQSMKRGKIIKSDVLVVKDGATTGKVSFVSNNFPFEKAAVNEHVFILRAKELLLQEFLFCFLYSPLGQIQIQQEFHGAAQGGINQQFVNGVYIPIPTLDIQKRIIAELKEKMNKAETLQSILRNQQSTIDALPQSILCKAFRGEL